MLSTATIILTFILIVFFLFQSLWHIFHELQQLGLMSRNIPSVPLHTRYRIFFSLVYRSLHTFNKDSISPLHWHCQYSSLVSKYSNCTEVFCDGSFHDTLCGCVVWCASFSLQAKFPSGTSIFTAELYAIFCAATYVSTLPGHFLILTDSLNSVTVSGITTVQRYIY